MSDTTLRARRDEWIAAGVFEAVRTEALAAFDRIVGLDLDEIALDGSLHKAPYGGEGTGPNPTDRGKRPVATSRVGATTPILGVVAAFALVGSGVGLFQVPNLSYVMGAFPDLSRVSPVP